MNFPNLLCLNWGKGVVLRGGQFESNKIRSWFECAVSWMFRPKKTLALFSAHQVMKKTPGQLQKFFLQKYVDQIMSSSCISYYWYTCTGIPLRNACWCFIFYLIRRYPKLPNWISVLPSRLSQHNTSFFCEREKEKKFWLWLTDIKKNSHLGSAPETKLYFFGHHMFHTLKLSYIFNEKC